MPFAEIVREALVQTEQRLMDRGVKVSVASKMPTVNADRRRLVEAVVNQVESSIKYTAD